MNKERSRLTFPYQLNFLSINRKKEPQVAQPKFLGPKRIFVLLLRGVESITSYQSLLHVNHRRELIRVNHGLFYPYPLNSPIRVQSLVQLY